MTYFPGSNKYFQIKLHNEDQAQAASDLVLKVQEFPNWKHKINETIAPGQQIQVQF